MDHATGARLRAAREEQGLTPGEVAAAIGIPPEAVTDVEQGDALRHYGPGLAAAWTWAVGRHLGVAIDHELATWQPPGPDEPAAGHDPLHGDPEPADHADGDVLAAGSSDAGALADDEAGDLAFREPKIEPGWLADYDHDPLESFDPSSTERGEAPGEDATGAESADPWSPHADPWSPHDEEWASPEDDLWGPEAGAGSTPPSRDPDGGVDPVDGDDPFATMNLRAVDPTSAEPASADPWKPGGQGEGGPHAARAQAPTGQRDAAEEERGVPPPPATEPLAHDRLADETGELPAADDTRVLAYTEGDDAAPLEAPSRLRTVGGLVVALVVLVAAGVGVGALAAQLLDPATESPTADDDGDADLADQPEEPGEGDDAPASSVDDDPFEEPGREPDVSDEALAGDPDAAAEPGDTSVQILDGAADDDRYGDAQDVLDDLGYQVIASGPAASAYDETTVFVTDGFADEAAALAEADDRFAHRQPNDVGLSEDVELHVIVGEDWPGPSDG